MHPGILLTSFQIQMNSTTVVSRCNCFAPQLCRCRPQSPVVLAFVMRVSDKGGWEVAPGV